TILRKHFFRMFEWFRKSSVISFVLMIARYAIFDSTITSNSGVLDATGFEGDRCPPGFDLVRGGQCRYGSLKAQLLPTNEAINRTIEICAKLKASPIIIRDEEDQTYWTDTTPYPTISRPIGIICNYSTSKWQWTDGSAIKYKPTSYSNELNDPCSKAYPGSWLNYQNGSWTYGSRVSIDNFNISCIVDLPTPKITTECSDFEQFESGSACYQLTNTLVNWTIADKYCKSVGASLGSVHNEQDNGFLRRLAISRGLVNGLLLGASSSVKLNDFKWIDGSDWNYTNFVPGFPVRGLGTCLAMATNGIAGQWTNSECSTKMPFACSRKPFAEGSTKTCPGASVKEGDIIVSPGFPTNASIPCDFFLTVAGGGLVEVDIILLEANSCCDNLVITEGSVGGTVIANLTGAISGATYRTEKMNMMRVSWQPRGGVNVRGLLV
ncbi:hypothetical protein PENTCL1PPCAC_8654, partial [Pristionchus entomophagus]